MDVSKWFSLEIGDSSALAFVLFKHINRCDKRFCPIHKSQKRYPWIAVFM